MDIDSPSVVRLAVVYVRVFAPLSEYVATCLLSVAVKSFVIDEIDTYSILPMNTMGSRSASVLLDSPEVLTDRESAPTA